MSYRRRLSNCAGSSSYSWITYQLAAERERKRVDLIAKRQQDEAEQRQLDQERAATRQLFETWLPIWNSLPEAEQRAIWQHVHGNNNFLSYDNPKQRANHVPLEPCLRELVQRRSQEPPPALERLSLYLAVHVPRASNLCKRRCKRFANLANDSGAGTAS